MSDDSSNDPRPKKPAEQGQSEFRKKLTQSMLENLNKAGQEARQREEEESRYQPLSKEEWDAVAEDLKEHLRLTEELRRLHALGKGMVESIAKLPKVH